MSASESAAALRTVEVFADVLCPFTHVGLRTLIGRRNERGLTQPRLRIRGVAP